MGTKMRLISVVICGLFYSALANDEKQAKNIGIFNVVRFPNAACEGSNANMGTCYTAEECEDNSGTASGSCADGYGVCCIFSINCGGKSSQNLTMFMSNNVEAGACSAEICKTNSEIVQLRLDFTSFVISNPANGVATSFALLNGERSLMVQLALVILLMDNVMKIPSLSLLLEVLDHPKFVESTLVTICTLMHPTLATR